MFSGDQFYLPLTWTDANNNVFDLRSYHARMSFFQNYPDLQLVLQITDPLIAGLGITLNNVSPNILAQIPNAQTVLTTRPNYHILELQDTSGNWFRVMVGRLLYER